MKFHSTRAPGVYYKQTSTGRTYYIDYKDTSGRRRREKVAGDYDVAKAALGNILARRMTGEAIAGRVDVAFGEYAEQVIARAEASGKLKPQSARNYRQNLTYIVPIIGKKKLSKLTKHDILRVIDHCKERGLSGWTINGVVTVMSKVMESANWDYDIPNHVRSLKASHKPQKKSTKVMRVPNAQEIDKLIAMAAIRGGKRGEALIALAIYSGLRQSELLGLWWEDLDLSSEVPVVRVHAQLGSDGHERLPYLKGKDEGQERVVEIPRHVAKTLREWKLASRNSGAGDFVFASDDGDPYTQSALRYFFTKVCADAGAEDVTFHDMRHTFASILIGGGANIVEVQHALGHAKASVTLDTYAHLWNAEERQGRLRDILEAASL